jgi:uracil-DNA glycosylase
VVAEPFSAEQVHTLVDEALNSSASVPVPVMSYLELDVIEQVLTILDFHKIDPDIRNSIWERMKIIIADGPGNIELGQLHTKIHNCRRCPGATPRPFSPVGNLVNPKVLFVLEHPFNDVVPLEQAAIKARISKEDSAVTFMTRCRFVASEPGEFELNNCSGYLFTEIDYLKPLIIVPVGSTPTKMFLGNEAKITAVHGQKFWLGEHCVIPILSPLHAAKANMSQNFVSDLNYIAGQIYA